MLYETHRPMSDLRHILPEFRALSEIWTTDNIDAKDINRLYALILNIRQVLREEIEGEFVELGVYRGHSAAVLTHYAREAQRTTYLFDTFEGFDKRDFIGMDSVKDTRGYDDTSIDMVRRITGDDKVVFCKGHFPESIPVECEAKKFAVMHIDCDLSRPAKSALEFFYPRMTCGALMMIHDYAGWYWDGIKVVADEFFADKPERIVVMPDMGGTAVVRKS